MSVVKIKTPIKIFFYTFLANLVFCIRNLGLDLDPLFARSLDPNLDLVKSHGEVPDRNVNETGLA
jgi:hypothetical protein